MAKLTKRQKEEIARLPPALQKRKWVSSKGIAKLPGSISEETAEKMRRFIEETDKPE